MRQLHVGLVDFFASASSLSGTRTTNGTFSDGLSRQCDVIFNANFFANLTNKTIFKRLGVFSYSSFLSTIIFGPNSVIHLTYWVQDGAPCHGKVKELLRKIWNHTDSNTSPVPRHQYGWSAFERLVKDILYFTFTGSSA